VSGVVACKFGLVERVIARWRIAVATLKQQNGCARWGPPRGNGNGGDWSAYQQYSPDDYDLDGVVNMIDLIERLKNWTS
jgi:hypothetical protein